MKPQLIVVVVVVLLCQIVALAGKETEKEAKDEVKEFSKSKIIEDGAKIMKDASLLQDTKNSKAAEASLDAAKGELAESFDKYSYSTVSLAKGIATGITKGVPDLIKGFKTKQWYYVLSGSLKILTALTTAAGPYGALAGPILSILTIVLNMYGAPAVESQEDMIKRVFKDTLIEELKAEASGIRTYYSTLQSQIEVLREVKDQPDYLNTVEIEELHILSYDNFAIFGRLESKIGESCYPDSVNANNKVEKDSVVNRCFHVLKMYCQLSLMRQMLLAQLSGLSKEKKLKSAQASFLNLIKQAQSTDQNVLNFLTKPLENPAARYTIYRLYANQHKYPIIIEYLKRLDLREEVMEDVEVKTDFDKDNAMFCDLEWLQGNCRLVEKALGSSGKIKKYPDNWGPITKSIFIPPNVKVMAKTGLDTYIGPFHGLSVFSSKGILPKIYDIQVLAGTTSIEEMALVCIDEGWCQKVEEMATFQLLKSLGGRDFSSVNLLLVPEGYEVTLRNSDTAIGPIYGRQIIKKFCKPKWTEIKVVKSKLGTKSAADFPLVCEESNYEGYCQQLGEEFKKSPISFDSLKVEGKKVCGISKVGSLNVPATLRVSLFGKDDILDGPHTGPVEMPNLATVGITKASVSTVKTSTTSKRSKTSVASALPKRLKKKQTKKSVSQEKGARGEIFRQNSTLAEVAAGAAGADESDGGNNDILDIVDENDNSSGDDL